MAADEAGQAYNINADTAAGEIAAAISAEKLLLLTDVSGILADRDDPGSLVREVDAAGVRRMIAEGKVGGGMIPKVECCVRAIAQGVCTTSIIDGRVPHSLLLEILTPAVTNALLTAYARCGDLPVTLACSHLAGNPRLGREVHAFTLKSGLLDSDERWRGAGA